jgi:hypothetical protein
MAFNAASRLTCCHLYYKALCRAACRAIAQRYIEAAHPKSIFHNAEAQESSGVQSWTSDQHLAAADWLNNEGRTTSQLLL